MREAWFSHTILTLVLVFFLAGSALAQSLPGDLEKAWRATRLPGDSLSLHVQEIGGPTLISINAAQPRNPASVMKMVTTWAGLSGLRSEEHTSELQSLMRISYAVFCL